MKFTKFNPSKGEILLYQSDSGAVKVEARLENKATVPK